MNLALQNILATTLLAAVAWADLCPLCDTLEDLYVDMENKMPTSGSELYVHPEASDMADFETVVGEMLDGTTACASIDLLSLVNKYDLGLFTDSDNNQTYCALVTKSIAHPWGNVVVYQGGSAKSLSIDSPHPIHDSNTGEQAMDIFKGTNARSFLVSGSHRNANDEAACQSSYDIADAAHTINCFQAAANAIMAYYENNDEDYTAIQFHGMGSSTCGNIDAYFTHGKGDIVPQAQEKIDILKDEMETQLPNGIFNIPGDQPYCNLAGSSNVQGRLINGVSPENVCTASSAGYTGRFIHVEQKSWLRAANMRSTWVDAINNVYSAFSAASPPRGLTLTYPNGGEVLGQGTLVPIQWTSEGVDPAADIHISVGTWIADEYDYEQGIVHESPWAVNGDGEHDWRVRTGLDVGDYVIRIRKQDETGVLDYSDSTFSVVEPFAITYPNGGQVLTKGQTYEITWDIFAGGVDTVKLSLHKNENFYKNIASTTNNDGSFSWTISNSWDTGSNFKIRIRNVDYTSSKDYSDMHFTIVDP